MDFAPPENPDGPPPAVGQKFSADGDVLEHPGNTIICHIHDRSVLWALEQARMRLTEADRDGCWGWLPVSSYHMTVFDGVSHAERHGVDHPAALPENVTAAACDSFVLNRMQQFDPQDTPTFNQRPARLGFHRSGGIWVELAANAGEEQRLRKLRDRIADVLGLRRPNHETYLFHITLAYLVRWPSSAALAAMRDTIAGVDKEFRAAAPEIPLAMPEVCLYRGMAHFDTQFRLGAKQA